jgi:hypothetical protein
VTLEEPAGLRTRSDRGGHGTPSLQRFTPTPGAPMPDPSMTCGSVTYSERYDFRCGSCVTKRSRFKKAARNFIGDEGRSFGFGDQVADPKPPRAALVKSHGGERCGNVGTMIPAGTVERGERKRTVDEVSKAD